MGVIQFSHSNGFSAKTYSSFFQHLPSHYELRYVDAFGRGKYPPIRGWDKLTEELVEAVRAAPEPVIGIGHSLGGVLTYKAAQKFPELFKAAILIEPPIVLGKTARMIYLAQRLGIGERMNPLAKRARVRKDFFASKEEASTYFKGKRLFQGFDEKCFQDYITYGLEPSGEGVKLVIPRNLEADIFNSLPTQYNWNFSLPLHFMYAESHQVLSKEVIHTLKRLLPKANFISYSDGGHMYPLENPSACAASLSEILENI